MIPINEDGTVTIKPVETLVFRQEFRVPKWGEVKVLGSDETPPVLWDEDPLGPHYRLQWPEIRVPADRYLTSNIQIFPKNLAAGVFVAVFTTSLLHEDVAAGRTQEQASQWEETLDDDDDDD